MLIYAIIFINLALVLYTIGVWAEKFQKTLKPWHLIFFFLGLICDTTGTLLMKQLSNNPDPFHGITGILAISLMLLHAIWAIYVLYKKDQIKLKAFHRFSIFVWIIWLIPFLSGVIDKI